MLIKDNEYVLDDEVLNNYYEKSSNPICNPLNLPPTVLLRLKDNRSFFTLNKLKEKVIDISDINGMKIRGKIINFKFPICLKNINYVKLYSLMASEGSCKTEFALHVREKDFHLMYKECMEKIFTNNKDNLVTCKLNKGFLRSRVSTLFRFLLPIPDYIPKFIFNNKKYAKEYLKIAFEAEGSPIFNLERNKKYIKLTRNTDVTSLVNNSNFLLGKRVYINKLRTLSNYNKILSNPPALLVGEGILLKMFDIESKIVLEACRKNKTAFRKGKISSRWVLYIYANNVKKFAEEIGFISNSKNKKLQEMLLYNFNKPHYSAINLMRDIADNNVFSRKKFVYEMKKIGYKSPGCYLSRYLDYGFIDRISYGIYKILV